MDGRFNGFRLGRVTSHSPGQENAPTFAHIDEAGQESEDTQDVTPLAQDPSNRNSTGNNEPANPRPSDAAAPPAHNPSISSVGSSTAFSQVIAGGRRPTATSARTAPSQVLSGTTLPSSSLAPDAGAALPEYFTRPLTPVPDQEAEALPSTFSALENWSIVAEDRARTIQIREARARAEQEARARKRKYDVTYKKIKDWADQQDKREMAGFWDSVRNYLFPQPKCPEDEDVFALIKYCYPPRMTAIANVYDFGDEKTHYYQVPVGEIEQYWQPGSKPDWVNVRWIHVPFGRGVAHSSVEDLFRHCHKVKREFFHSGEAGWPYLETESLNFRSIYDFSRMRDSYFLFKDRKGMSKQLDMETFAKDQNRTLKSDMEWRAGHIGATMDYWSLVQTDLPSELADGVGHANQAKISNYQHCLLGPVRGLKPLSRHYDRQSLSNHPFFKGSQLVRNDWRGFHGNDNYLLTMSAASGVDYLDRDFPHYLDIPRKWLLLNPDATCIGRTAHRFKEHGTSTWHRKTAEWLLVYLITEIGSTPHNMNMGGVAPSLEEAYQAVVLDLNRRRFDKWQKRETVDLVREYLFCIDELSYLLSICDRKVRLFRGLKRDCEGFESNDQQFANLPDNPSSESAVDRAVVALRQAEESYTAIRKMHSDLRESLNSLFQLRTIEQDELAILADRQSKAVLIFTTVTIVFLPLSFFTSYFGMNLQDIVGTPRTQAFFWEVCGSITGVFVLVVMLGALFHHKFLSKHEPRGFHNIIRSLERKGRV